MFKRLPILFFLFTFLFNADVPAQLPVVAGSADILMQLKKLNVLGSVLYIAAHPDDENNGLLPYLAKEKLYRTGYLSLTRGDGGQNLIGSEQGIELGLIRTQELLAARRIDGAEQFFSRAYEFGFSKNADEALRIWDRNKILSDVVWVIRQYQPDVIIRRFPPDARAGHGHHAASAILAEEAFTAAADPNKFPEQFTYGVKPWKAKRILWNTYNFGGNNTTSEEQLKLDVSGYNPLIGKSYGELGGEARSMHKSQGEGRPRRRGPLFDYFLTTGGDAAKTSLMDGIDIEWSRLPGGAGIQAKVNEIIAAFNFQHPELSVNPLVELYSAMQTLPASNWKDLKLAATQELIEQCAALFTEATTSQETVVQGESVKVNLFLNVRLPVHATLKGIRVQRFDTTLTAGINPNQNISFDYNLMVENNKPISQPYWLVNPPMDGSFDVKDQQLIGKAENDPPYEAYFTINIHGKDFTIKRPVQYKVVDAVKGELYQPLVILPKAEVNFTHNNFISANGKEVNAGTHFLSNVKNLPPHQVITSTPEQWRRGPRTYINGAKDSSDFVVHNFYTPVTSKNNFQTTISAQVNVGDAVYDGYRRTIAYDHIPTITYFAPAKANLLKLDIKMAGKKIGYFDGAGDKVPDELTQMGYEVTYLHEADLNEETLGRYDAIVVGIRAFNIFDYLSNKHEILNRYVYNGGNLIVQYLKSNQVGLNPVIVGPYPFSISSGSRVTEEDAKVNILLPSHSVFNYPNKITPADFEGWIQERSTYQADKADSHYEKLIGIKDTNDKTDGDGSLLVAKYGKGNFAYVSLVLFRQLPAGVPGAYRLMANLIAIPKNKMP